MFTIIIPTHERPVLLRRTLRSLINQNFKNFTVIIVSDSPLDVVPHEELAALPGLYRYVQRNGISGPALSRNLALSMVETEYVLFLDDDDTFEPNHLESLAQYLTQHPTDICFCDFKVLNEDRTESPPRFISTQTISIADVTRASVFVKNRIPNSALVFSKTSIKEVRNDPDLILYEDWDFLLDCLTKYDLRHLPISSVVIHKSISAVAENTRRGNSNDHKIIEVMLELYKKYPAGPEIAQVRQKLFQDAGINLPLEVF